MEGRMIKKRTHLRLLASLGGEVEMLFGAGEIPGKAEKFEQKGAALGILGVVAHFGAKCLNGFVRLTGLKQLLWGHGPSVMQLPFDPDVMKCQHPPPPP